MADRVKIKIDGDDSGFRKTLEGIGGVAKNSLKTVVAGAAAVGTAFTAITAKALDFAGSLEQNIGGSEAVFKEFASTIQDTADTAFKNMGLSASDFLATANKMGALMQGSGISIKDSADLSAKVMQRAADVASIMGIDVSFAMESIAGAAKGNFTMMDNLGVAMNATTLEAYALSKGIKKSYADMDNATKVQLAMEMFLEKTAYAAGNYAKENETLAGALTTAKAALTNFMSGAGSVNDVVESLTNAADVIADNIVELVPKLAEGFSGLANELIPKLPDMFEKMLPGMDKGINTLLSSVAGSAPDFANVAAKLIASFAKAIIKNIPNITNASKEIASAAMDGIGELIPILKPATSAIKLLTNNLNILLPAALAAVAVFKGFSIVSTITTWFNAAKDAVIIYNAALRAQAAGATLTTLANTALNSGLTASQVIVGVLAGEMNLATAATYALAVAKKALSGATGLVIAGIAALVVGVVAWIATAKDEQTQTDVLIEQSKERNKQLGEQKKAYDDLKAAQIEQASADLAQIAYTETLYDELQTLASATGEVNEADRGRVNFILGELNNAYGTEYALIDGVITGYQKMQTEIDNLIQKKQLEILQKAALPAYEKAVTEEMQKRMEAADALMAVEEKRAKVNELNAQIAEIQAKITERGGSATIDEAKAINYLLTERNKENAALQELEKTYESSNAAIKASVSDKVNYEKAMQLASEGNFDAAIAQLSEYQSGYAEAMKSAEGDIEKQKQTTATYYAQSLTALEEYAKNYNAGVEGYNESGLKLMIQNANDMYAKAQEVGVQVDNGVIAGLDERQHLVSEKVKEISNMIPEGMKKLLNIQSPSRVMRDKVGKMITAGIAVGIDDGKTEVQKVLENMSDDMLDEEGRFLSEAELQRRDAENASYAQRVRESKTHEELQKTIQDRAIVLQKRGLDDYNDALKKAYEESKDIVDAHEKDLEKSKEDIIKIFEETWDNASDILDEFEEKQADFGEGIKKHISLYNTTTKKITEMPGYHIGEGGLEMEVPVLADLGAMNEDIKKYGERLEKLKPLVSEGLYQEVLGMDPEEANQFMNAFFAASEEQQKEFVSEWEKLPDSIKNVTNGVFADEGNKMREEIIKTFGQIPEDFFNIGDSAAEKFGAAFMTELNMMLAEACNAINASLAGMLPVGSSGAIIARGAYSGSEMITYEDNRTTTIYANNVTAHDIVEAQNQNEIRQSHTNGWATKMN